MNDSIAVVVLDAVRADFFEEWFGWMPGQRYEQVYSTSHWTVPAHASLLTGLLPRETGTYAGSPSFYPPFRPLPERLQEAGYTTRLYTANIQLVQWEGWSTGFDEVVGPEPDDERTFDWLNASSNARMPRILRYPEIVIQCLMSDSPTIASISEGWELLRDRDTGLTATDLYDSVRERDDTEQSEFALFNLMDVHSSTGRSFGEAISEGVPNPADLVDGYRRSISNLSDSYRDLFEYLYDEFDWVITLSDHGELLGEYDLSGHGYGIYPELVEIPLVVSSREHSCSHPTDRLVSLLDIPATIGEITGLGEIGRGNSLLNQEPRQRAPVERLGQPHLHEEMFKRNGIHDEFQRYDKPLRGVAIDGEGYAYETGTGTESTEGWERNDRSEINSAFEGVSTHTATAGSLEVPDGVKNRLRDLGYA